MYINLSSDAYSLLGSKKNTSDNLTTSLTRLSSGLKINSATDDASGIAIADKLQSTSNVYVQSLTNVNNGIALLQIADKAMNEMSNILDIIKSKAVQMANGTLSDQDRLFVKDEIIKLIQNFDHIACTTNYNGTYPLDYKEDPIINFQTGEYEDDVVSVALSDTITSCNLGEGQPYNLYDFLNGFSSSSMTTGSADFVDLPANSTTVLDASGVSGSIEIRDSSEHTLIIDPTAQVNDVETYTGVNGTVTYDKITKELTITANEIMQIQPLGATNYDYLNSFPTSSSLVDNVPTQVLDIRPTIDDFDVSFNNFTNSGTSDVIEIKNSSGATVLLIDDTGIVTNTDPDIAVNITGEQIDISFTNVSDTYSVFATDDIKNSSTIINDIVTNSPLYNLTQDATDNEMLHLIDGQVDTAAQDGIETHLFRVPKESDSTTIDLSTMSSSDELLIRDTAGNLIGSYKIGDPDLGIAGITLSGSTLLLDPTSIGIDLDVSVVPDDSNRTNIQSGILPNFDWSNFTQDSNGFYNITDFDLDTSGVQNLDLSNGSLLQNGSDLFTDLPTSISSVVLNTTSFGTAGSTQNGVYSDETLRLSANGSTLDITTTILNNLVGTSNNLVDTDGNGSFDSILFSDPNVADVYFPVILDTNGNIQIINKDAITIDNFQGDLSARMFGGAAMSVDGISIQVPNGNVIGPLNIQADVHIPTIVHQPLSMDVTNFTTDPAAFTVLSQENCVVCSTGYENLNSEDLQQQAMTLLGVVDAGLTQLNIERSNFAAASNRLESKGRIILQENVNAKKAESYIRDIDYAKESANFSAWNIISQTGSFRMSQINDIQSKMISFLYK